MHRKYIYSCSVLICSLLLASCNMNTDEALTEAPSAAACVTPADVCQISPAASPTQEPASDDQQVKEIWEVVTRLRYVQGTIQSLEKQPDGRSLLKLKVEKNYHSGADPVDSEDSPFPLGDVEEFYIKSQTEIDLKEITRIIIYEGMVMTDSKDSFLAANIRYYEKDSKFYDFDGNQIDLPPDDYPSTLY